MKDNICKIKSKRLIRKWNSYPLRWSKFILSKNIVPITRNIRRIRLIGHFSRNTKLRLPSMKTLFPSLKSLIPSCQIQGIFYLSLINCKKKRIPLCRSILPQNRLWTSFIRYERTMEFIWVRRWSDSYLSPLYNRASFLYITN